MTDLEYPKTGILILAAGNSSRLGKAKQLLSFQGENLLQRAIKAAEKSISNHAVVVLGAYENEIKSIIDFSSSELVVNYNWGEGMSSSMKIGLSNLIKSKNIDQVVIMLSDQPFVNEILLNSMITTQFESKKGIICCAYDDTLGVPVLFTRKYFEELFSLKIKEGAKKVIYNHLEDCEIIPFDKGAIDIDTQEDYDQLLGKKAD